MKLLLATSILIKCALCYENSNQTDIKQRNDHPLHMIWIANSIIGAFGILFNGLVIWIFFQERTKLVTSVNAMIM